MEVKFWFFYLQRTIKELDVNAEKSQILEIAISKALDHKAAHREMTSVLISDLYGKILSAKDVATGFDAILNNLAELTIDTPEAPSVSLRKNWKKSCKF